MKRIFTMVAVAAIATATTAVPAFAQSKQVQPNQCRDSINVVSCNSVNVDVEANADLL